MFRCADTAFTDTPVVEDLCLSDHYIITASLPFSKPKCIKKSIKTRNIKNIDLSCFQLALNESLLEIKDKISSFSLNNCVSSILNKFAPVKDKLITIRPAAPWFNLVVKAQKQVRRKAERMYKKTKLTVHRQIMKFEKNKTIKVINEEKEKYINEKISSSNNSKQLHFVLNSLTSNNNKLILPSDTPTEILPDKFNSFFCQ